MVAGPLRRRELGESLHECLLLGILLYPVFAIPDLVYANGDTDKVIVALVTRFIIVFVTAIYLQMYRAFKPENIFVVSFGIFILEASVLGVIFIIHVLSFYHTTYFVGLSLQMFAISAILRWKPIFATLQVIFTMSAYYAAMFYALGFEAWLDKTMVMNNFFFFCTGVLAAFGAFISARHERKYASNCPNDEGQRMRAGPDDKQILVAVLYIFGSVLAAAISSAVVAKLSQLSQ